MQITSRDLIFCGWRYLMLLVQTEDETNVMVICTRLPSLWWMSFAFICIWPRYSIPTQCTYISFCIILMIWCFAQHFHLDTSYASLTYSLREKKHIWNLCNSYNISFWDIFIQNQMTWAMLSIVLTQKQNVFAQMLLFHGSGVSINLGSDDSPTFRGRKK